MLTAIAKTFSLFFSHENCEGAPLFLVYLNVLLQTFLYIPLPVYAFYSMNFDYGGLPILHMWVYAAGPFSTSESTRWRGGRLAFHVIVKPLAGMLCLRTLTWRRTGRFSFNFI